MKVVLGCSLGNTAAHGACTAYANCFNHSNQLTIDNGQLAMKTKMIASSPVSRQTLLIAYCLLAIGFTWRS
jgi:hypothetical protein